jgi:hygromycin-B 7''-O-kinase
MAFLEARVYSERLGSLKGEQLQAACDRFGLGQIEQAEPASAGLWGQSVMLTTTTGAFVLRGNPAPQFQFKKERAVAAVLHQRSPLPVPWPYHSCADTEPFGWPYALMPTLPGVLGSRLWEAANDVDRVQLAAAHGTALAALHQVQFDAPGPYDPASDKFVAVSDFTVWTLERIEVLRAGCRLVAALSAADERFIDELLGSCSAALDEPLVSVMVHHDFSLANTTYLDADDGFVASGVFDLGEVHIGDGEEDLVRFLFRRRREQRRTLYALADLLFMWEVSTRVTGWFGDAAFVAIAEPIIRNAREAAS